LGVREDCFDEDLLMSDSAQQVGKEGKEGKEARKRKREGGEEETYRCSFLRN